MKLKKIIACLLLICLVFNISATPAEASFNIDDYILAQAIILTGITLTNGVVYTEVKNLLYNSMSNLELNTLKNQLQDIRYGAVIWGTGAWSLLKNKISELFNSGDNVINKDGILVSNPANLIGGYFSSITSLNGSVRHYSANGEVIYRYKDGVMTNSYTGEDVLGYIISSNGIVSFHYNDIGGNLKSVMVTNFDVNNPNDSRRIISGVTVGESIAITANPNVDNLNDKWGSMYIPPDLTAEETGTYGKNIVGIPSDVLDGSISLDQAMERDIWNKSASDVLNTPIANTDVNSYAGVETGTIGETNTVINNIGGSLASILSQILSILNSISSSLTTFFDLTIPINFQPLTQIGNSITEKFPFSLPWDYLRGLSCLTSVNGFDKKFSFSFFNAELEIDLSVLDVPIGFLRIGELIIFDISLIMATRKLLGGAV